MNINAHGVIDYLQKKAEETNNPSYGCEADELLYYVKIGGQSITQAQLDNAIKGDNGLQELRFIYQIKGDPKIYLSNKPNRISPDANGSTPEQRKAWLNSSFVKYFSSDKDATGNTHTLAVVKVEGSEEARIVIPVICEDGTYEIDESKNAEIGTIRYMTDSRHPYILDDDPAMPIVLAATNLKAPGKNKYSGHWDLPKDLKDCGLTYYKILQRATSAAIDHVSHEGGKTFLKLAIAYTATVAQFKDRAFKSTGTLKEGIDMEVSKNKGDTMAVVFLNEDPIGSAFWKASGRGFYKGYVKLTKSVKDSDEVKEFASTLLEAGSVRKIKPLNETKKNSDGFENKPFEKLELPKKEAKKKASKKESK